MSLAVVPSLEQLVVQDPITGPLGPFWIRILLSFIVHCFEETYVVSSGATVRIAVGDVERVTDPHVPAALEISTELLTQRQSIHFVVFVSLCTVRSATETDNQRDVSDLD